MPSPLVQIGPRTRAAFEALAVRSACAEFAVRRWANRHRVSPEIADQLVRIWALAAKEPNSGAAFAAACDAARMVFQPANDRAVA